MEISLKSLGFVIGALRIIHKHPQVIMTKLIIYISLFVRIHKLTKLWKEVKSIQSQNLSLSYVNTILQKLM
jgi:hypothetical protein